MQDCEFWSIVCSTWNNCRFPVDVQIISYKLDSGGDNNGINDFKYSEIYSRLGNLDSWCSFCSSSYLWCAYWRYSLVALRGTCFILVFYVSTVRWIIHFLPLYWRTFVCGGSSFGGNNFPAFTEELQAPQAAPDKEGFSALLIHTLFWLFLFSNVNGYSEMTTLRYFE